MWLVRTALVMLLLLIQGLEAYDEWGLEWVRERTWVYESPFRDNAYSKRINTFVIKSVEGVQFYLL